MNHEQSNELVRYLSDRTPGWYDKDGAMVTAAVALAKDLLDLDYEPASRAMESVAHSWTRNTRPPLGVIFDAYRDAAASVVASDDELELTVQWAGGSLGCDGSGWRGGIPCGRCNPILAEVYRSPLKWARWRSGWPLHRLLGRDWIVVEAGIGRAVRPTPPACVPTEPDQLDVNLPPETAMGPLRQATWDWWVRAKDGSMGHYPGCDCERCVKGEPINAGGISLEGLIPLGGIARALAREAEAMSPGYSGPGDEPF